jgi:hypothetical protein
VLYVDRPVITIQDLTSLEGGIADVIEKESIVVTGQASVLLRASSEAVNSLIALVTSYGTYGSSGSTGLSPEHLANVYGVGFGTSATPRIHASQIIVSNDQYGLWSPIKLWLLHFTMREIFRAAWNRKLESDKYSAKAENYMGEADRYSNSLRSAGIPIVWNPLFAPAALFQRDSGTWTTNNVSAVPGFGTATGDYIVTVTYVSGSYISSVNHANSESAPAEDVVCDLTSGQVLRVDISTLYPFSADYSGNAHGLVTPKIPIAWNVYVNRVLQNAVPIPIQQKVYTLTGNPAATGYRLRDGQEADVWHVIPSYVPVFRG